MKKYIIQAPEMEVVKIEKSNMTCFGNPVIELVTCKECKHRPIDPYNEYCGHNILFPDCVCPCQCVDPFFNYMPDDEWYCGSGEKKEGTENAEN